MRILPSVISAFVASLISLAGVVPAAAEEGGFYGGVGISYVNTDACYGLGFNGVVVTDACQRKFDGAATGARGTLGYQFGPMFSVEGGLHYLGTIDNRYITSCYWYDPNDPFAYVDPWTRPSGAEYLCNHNDEDITSFGSSLSLLVHTDRTRQLSGFFRAGGYFGTVDRGGDRDSASSTSGTYLLGAGIDFRIWENASFRGEVEYLPDLGGQTSSGGVDHVAFTLSLIFDF